MRVGSLFSGIGGMDAGLARVGFEHVFFCESEPYRRDVLRVRFPGVPVYDDVRSLFRGEPARTVDLLCGGFPCQDLSVAGKRAGLAGERSGLFFEFARVIGLVRPRWVLLENVPGILSSNGGRDFGVVLETLADLGYGVAWRVVDSRFFGVPQRRRRVFILGAVADGDPAAAARRAGEVLAVGSRCERHLAAGTEARSDSAGASPGGTRGGGWINSGAGWWDEHDGASMTLSKRDNKDATTLVAAPLTKGSASGKGVNAPGRRQEDDVNIVATAFHQTQEPIHGEEFTPAIGKTSIGMGLSNACGVRRLTPRECERLQGLDDDWTQLGDTTDGKRYSALGDAVTATVAEWIGGRIKEAA